MDFISPSQLARAAGVSESSVKRWCDQGRIAMVKTAGGHRRLTLDVAAEFLRHIGSDIKPEFLGLPSRNRRKDQGIDEACVDLMRAFIAGEQSSANQILLDLHLADMSIARICDKVVAQAFHRLGTEWECGQVEVYQERRSCGMCHRALEEIKRLLPRPKPQASLAVGGTPECDPYTLPSTMVELTLQQAGWQAESLGSRIPFESMIRAIRELKPRLFWLSVSHIDNELQFIESYRRFYQQVVDEVAIIVGGRALNESMRRNINYTAHCDSLQHLESLAKSLKRIAPQTTLFGTATASSRRSRKK